MNCPICNKEMTFTKSFIDPEFEYVLSCVDHEIGIYAYDKESFLKILQSLKLKKESKECLETYFKETK